VERGWGGGSGEGELREGEKKRGLGEDRKGHGGQRRRGEEVW